MGSQYHLLGSLSDRAHRHAVIILVVMVGSGIPMALMGASQDLCQFFILSLVLCLLATARTATVAELTRARWAGRDIGVYNAVILLAAIAGSFLVGNCHSGQVIP